MLRDFGESGAIEAMARTLDNRLPDGWIGIGDDAAVTAADGKAEVLTTTDMLVEGVHFSTRTTGAADLGWKALAVNVSDIYGMGGFPLWAVVAVALPGHLSETWLDDLYGGLRDASRHFSAPIVGGDTVGTPGPIVISVTVVGKAERPRLRSDARPGDVLVTSGSLGLAAAGLWALTHQEVAVPDGFRKLAVRSHLHPVPEPSAGVGGLTDRFALMDNSDGLGSCARTIAVASNAKVVVEVPKLEISEAVSAIAAAARVDPIDWVLWGGEDYGLVGSISPASALPPAFKVIGHVCAGQGAWIDTGRTCLPIAPGGYRHF